MRILLAPDKFKGSLTADQVCEAMTLGIHDFDQSIEVISHPLADGGEGTSDLLENALGLKRIDQTVSDPLFRPVSAYYLRNDRAAFIEMANASGLQLLPQEERNPWHASTFGTGQMIAHAMENGAREIYLMIGGSATNDAGTGMAEALGFRFMAKGEELSKLSGGSLNQIEQVKAPETDIIPEVKFTVLTDVQNLLTGTNGAANVYGRQKGADDKMVGELDEGLKHLASVLDNGFENRPGAGAAGGLGYGAMSFLSATVRSGIGSVMEITGFDKALAGTDLIITGEGKMDLQTVEGKVIAGVAEKAREKHLPFSVICGTGEALDKVQSQLQAWAVYPLVNKQVTTAMAMENAFDLVRKRAYELAKAFSQEKA